MSPSLVRTQKLSERLKLSSGIMPIIEDQPWQTHQQGRWNPEEVC